MTDTGSSDTQPDEQPAPEAEAAEAAPPPRDPVHDELAAALRADLGDGYLEDGVAGQDLVVRVDRSSWRRAAEALRIRHGFEYFCFLSGIDWLKNAELSSRYEQTYAAENPEAPGDDSSPFLQDRVAGGEGRFTVFARLYDPHRKVGIVLKADLDDTNPSIESWVSLFRGADWHEREAWEMYGFDFEGHPALRHIYLPAEFEGYPLRKDFPLLARVVKPWPGLVDKEPVPGEDEETEEASA